MLSPPRALGSSHLKRAHPDCAVPQFTASVLIYSKSIGGSSMSSRAVTHACRDAQPQPDLSTTEYASVGTRQVVYSSRINAQLLLWIGRGLDDSCWQVLHGGWPAERLSGV